MAAGVTLEASCIASHRARDHLARREERSGAGTADAVLSAMILTKKNVNRVLKSMVAAMPAIPYIMRSRRRTPVMAYVVGGVGLAIVGGVAAVMFLSPRTRTKALTAAKDTYGKVNDKISHLRSETTPMSNGLVDHREPPAPSL